LNGTSATFSGSSTFGQTSTSASITTKSATGTGALLMQDGAAANKFEIGHYLGNYYIYSFANSTQALTLTSTGNLGLGVTPSAWSASYKAIQISSFASFTQGGNDTYVGNNWFNDGTNKYLQTSGASIFGQSNGSHFWLIAPSGTAGNAITFTQAMTLTASGNLGVGIATPLSILHIEKASQDNILAVIGQSGYEGALFLSSAGSGKDANIVVGNNRNLEFHTSSSATPVVDGTLRMTLTSSGVLTLPTTGSLEVGYSAVQGLYKLDVNGTGRFSTARANYFDIPSGTGFNAFQMGADTFSGGWYVYDATNGSYRFKIANSGAATFSSSVTALNYYGTDNANLIAENTNTNGTVLTLNSKGTVGIIKLQTASTDRLTIASTGAATFSSTCTATGFFESSDSRLKTLIQDNYQTKGIASITPKLYTKNGKVELGYYAQDFVGILDSAVSKGSDDMLSLSYREVLVAKVYALEQEIKELKAKMN